MHEPASDELKFLNQALHRTAFFSEAHSLKSIMALHRLSVIDSEFFSENRLAEMAEWNQVLKTPTVLGLCTNNVESMPLSAENQKDLLDGAVFPLAYLAATSWARERGLKNLILAYKNLAIERIGHLGHSWTIWCSFLECEAYIKSEEQSLLAAERFAELIATQLSIPDWVPSVSVNFSLETEILNEQDVIDMVCCYPGYFGHSVITLSYMFKYRSEFSAEQWRHSLARIYKFAQNSAHRSKNNIFVPKPDDTKEAQKNMLQKEMIDFLEYAPKEAHSLTLADAIWEFWGYVSNGTKLHLLSVLTTYGQALRSFKR